jgi:hypothetical protein
VLPYRKPSTTCVCVCFTFGGGGGGGGGCMHYSRSQSKHDRLNNQCKVLSNLEYNTNKLH